MTDRLTLEAGILPDLERTLVRAAGAAGSYSGSGSRLRAIFEDYVESFGLADRLEFRAGDFLWIPCLGWM